MGHTHVSGMAGGMGALNRSRIKHTLMESGFCIDSVRLLDWVLRHPWLRIIAFRFLRLRFSPAILTNALSQQVAQNEKSRLFSLGMSYVNVGDTYKTTGRDRTELADKVVKRLADRYGFPCVLEVGASDGISSLNLLDLLGGSAEVLLSDRFNVFYEKHFMFGSFFLDSDKRLLGVKMLCFYLNYSAGAVVSESGYRRIETVNPLLFSERGIKSIIRFNMLGDTLDKPADVIKCSNVLNKSYFTDGQILAAVNCLMQNLKENGAIVISQNNEKYVDGEAVLVLQKKNDELYLVESINDHDLLCLFVRLNSSFENVQRVNE